MKLARKTPIFAPFFMVTVLCLCLGGPTREARAAGHVVGVSAGSNAINPIPYSSGANVDQPLVHSPEGQAEALLDSRFQKCDQSCHYLKANENVTIQMDYVLKKLNYLKSRDTDDTTKRRVLGSFCHKDVDLDDCIKTYEKTTQFWLIKARGALGKNEKSIADLKCSSYDQAGNCLDHEGNKMLTSIIAIEGKAGQQQENLLPQMPHYIKSRDLGEYSRKVVRDSDIDRIAKSYEWKNFNQSLKPSRDDFVKFTKVFRDPEHPEMGTMEIPMSNSNGKLVYDEKAYQAALAEWNGIGRQIHEDITQDRDLRAVVQKNHQKLRTQFSAHTDKSKRSKQREIYDETRGELITGLQDFVKNSPQWGKTSELNFDTKDPKDSPSGVKDPKHSGVGEKRTPPTLPPPTGYTGEEEFVVPPAGASKTSSYSVVWHADQIKVRTEQMRAAQEKAYEAAPSKPEQNSDSKKPRNRYRPPSLHQKGISVGPRVNDSGAPPSADAPTDTIYLDF